MAEDLDNNQRSGGPVGSGNYEAQQGDCIESIAYKHGFFWRTLWDHPENQQLHGARDDPNALLPGDRVTIPPLRRKEVSGATEQRHRFRRKGVPAKLAFRLLFCDGRPRADLRYVLSVDGDLTDGVTDADGAVSLPIPPGAESATLLVYGNTDTEPEEYHLQLGTLDPISEISGIQARLNNLGWDCGPVDGVLGAETREAIRAFQGANGLSVTGTPNSSMRQRLRELHGS